MQAFLTILKYDLGQLIHSWVLRIWLPLLIAPAFALVVIANSESELASETLAFYIWVVMAPISAIATAILSAAAITGESRIISDSILSRSVTRSEYVAAKIIARVGFTLTIYLFVIGPFAYLLTDYAVADTSIGGVISGLVLVGAMLAFLATFGIAMSVTFSSVLPAVIVVLVAMTLSGAIFQFLGLNAMSTTAIMEQLPATFRGEIDAWEHTQVLLIFVVASIAALTGAVWLFRRKDL